MSLCWYPLIGGAHLGKIPHNMTTCFAAFYLVVLSHSKAFVLKKCSFHAEISSARWEMRNTPGQLLESKQTLPMFCSVTNEPE